MIAALNGAHVGHRDLDKDFYIYLPVWVFCSPTDHLKVQQMVGGIDP